MSDVAVNNVISLDEYDSARRKPGYGSNIKALEEIRELCCQKLILNVRYMMTKCDDNLYGCSQMAESITVEDLYLNAMSDLKAISSDLEKSFIGRFVAQFNLGIPRHIHSRDIEPGSEQAYSDSSYHRQELVSEKLAVCRMIENTRSECAETLRPLDKRIGFLLCDPDLELWRNPLSPEPICEAFRSAVTETVSRFEHGIELRPVLFKLFDEYVLSNLDSVYKELNFHLIKIGVQPRLQANAQSPDNNARLSGHQDFLFPNNAMPHREPGACFVPHHATSRTESGFVDEEAEKGRQLASKCLPPQQPDTHDPPQNRNAGRLGDITIDVVAMVFEHILEDKNISDSMRALLGRLQIPMIKVAIQEHRFFSDKNHPARVLLTRLADSAIGWDERLGHEDPLYRKIDSIVQTILDGFDQDVGLFVILLEDLEEYLGNVEPPSPVNDQRKIKVLEGEERLEDARSNAIEEVEERIRGGLRDDFISEFLTAYWKDLLLLICARQGRESDEWKQALETMDDLVWSVKPKNSEADRQRLVAMQPELLNSLREGMRRLSVPVTGQDEFITKLMYAHAYANTSRENKSLEQRAESVQQDGRMKTANADNVEDIPGRSRPGNFNRQNHSPGGYGAGIDDTFITQARQLKPGMWIEIIGSDGKIKPVKLSWMSPITKTYLLTDQSGLNAGNYSVEELAELLRSARVRS